MLASMLWRRRKSRIRKDAGELTIADFDLSPIWEFCLDEEGVEGQTECTVRPSRVTPPIESAGFDGFVACTLKSASGAEFFGTVVPTGGQPEYPDTYYPELWLPNRG